ncbi:hypothetical protein [uncultured Methylobacterium sp.]|uniref:hypothetical protein n=1 Tax=uncultured Methylobacterium sp. TaxID=157278 RepID=UPI0035CBB4A1
MKAPLVTVAGLLFLTGCVGTEPYAALRGSGPSLASLPAPIREEPQIATLSEPLPADVVSDDVVDAPARVARGTNPRAVLERRQTHLSDAPARTVRSVVAGRPSPTSEAAGPSRGAVKTAGLGDAPLPAAYLASTAAPAANTGTAPLLSEVEARAEVEQRAQTLRDQRFDAQVRRASNLVCIGCVPTTPSPSRRQIRQERRESDLE